MTQMTMNGAMNGAMNQTAAQVTAGGTRNGVVNGTSALETHLNAVASTGDKVVSIKAVDTPTNEVFKTTDYSKFKFMEMNREVGRDRVAKVRRSIEQVGLIPEPVLVNENMEIINGQARFTVCKEKGLPVYYQIVNGVGIDECIKMNTGTTNWTRRDFVRSYATCGCESYVFLEKMMEKYSLPFSTVVAVCTDTCGFGGGSGIKDGSFNVNQEDYMVIEATLSYLMGLAPDIKRMKGRRNSMYNVIAWAYRHTDADHGRLADAVNLAATDSDLNNVAIGNGVHALTIIERAYNAGVRGKKKIHLVSLYEDWHNKVGRYAKTA